MILSCLVASCFADVPVLLCELFFGRLGFPRSKLIQRHAKSRYAVFRHGPGILIATCADTVEFGAELLLRFRNTVLQVIQGSVPADSFALLRFQTRKLRNKAFFFNLAWGLWSCFRALQDRHCTAR